MLKKKRFNLFFIIFLTLLLCSSIALSSGQLDLELIDDEDSDASPGTSSTGSGMGIDLDLIGDDGEPVDIDLVEDEKSGWEKFKGFFYGEEKGFTKTERTGIFGNLADGIFGDKLSGVGRGMQAGGFFISILFIAGFLKIASIIMGFLNKVGATKKRALKAMYQGSKPWSSFWGTVLILSLLLIFPLFLPTVLNIGDQNLITTLIGFFIDLIRILQKIFLFPFFITEDIAARALLTTLWLLFITEIAAAVMSMYKFLHYLKENPSAKKSSLKDKIKAFKATIDATSEGMQDDN
jgi:hypothetical protein